MLASSVTCSIADDLTTLTSSRADVADVEEWRRAARRAGRRLGLRVRTKVAYGTVSVEAIDLPLPEWVRQDAERRRDALSRSLLGPPHDHT